MSDQKKYSGCDKISTLSILIGLYIYLLKMSINSTKV